ncbi:hypothetical protein B0H21DRAFT_886177 [Amylocystis lapponica]|nr:hypothetical protein B0H21DRAFT_886177 [Amylocystis lapponica]
MHQALHNLDVLTEIFHHMDPTIPQAPLGRRCSSSINWADRRNLAIAARVSRTFSEQALSVLWRKLDNFAPLLRLLSTVVHTRGPWNHWRINNTDRNNLHQRRLSDMCTMPYSYYRLRDNKPPDAAQWARFQRYARLVSSIEHTLSTGVVVDARVFSWLARHDNGASPLPLLRKLVWCRPSKYNKALFCIVSSSLACLEVEFNGSANPAKLSMAQQDKIYENTLRKLISHAPNLQELKISYTHIRPALGPMASCNRLRKLTLVLTSALDFPVLDPVADLDTLTDLDIALPDEDPSNVSGFRALQRLTVHGEVPQLVRFLSAISPLRLLEAEILFRESKSEADNNALGLMQTGNNVIGLVQAVTHPLLRLHTLECVRVRPRLCPLAWSDVTLYAMAAAWPNLRVLALQHRDWLRAAEIPSVYSLAVFARLCPRLQELHIPRMHPRLPLDTSVLGSVDSLPVHGLRVLRTKCSSGVGVDPAALAGFLYRVFPRLEGLRECVEEIQGGMRAREYEQWIDVLQRMQALQLARQQ